MIVRHRHDSFVLIDQNEHGRLAGALARHWGNEEFAGPEPLESVARAAAMHDEGWRDRDAVPLFNDSERRPLHFRELPVEEHIPLYRNGVQAVAAADPYAGLLVGMHWTGLYRGRWGLQPRGSGLKGATSDAEAQRTRAVEQEERRWAEVKATLLGDGQRRAPWEAALWHNFELLQALDLLSLYVSAGPHDKAPAAQDAAADAAVGLSLGDIDQPAGERSVPAPVRPAQPMRELVLRVREPGVVVVDPYPFAADSVRAAVTAPAIPARAYSGVDDVREALGSAATVEVACTFTRPGS